MLRIPNFLQFPVTVKETVSKLKKRNFASGNTTDEITQKDLQTLTCVMFCHLMMMMMMMRMRMIYGPDDKHLEGHSLPSLCLVSPHSWDCHGNQQSLSLLSLHGYRPALIHERCQGNATLAHWWNLGIAAATGMGSGFPNDWFSTPSNPCMSHPHLSTHTHTQTNTHTHTRYPYIPLHALF